MERASEDIGPRMPVVIVMDVVILARLGLPNVSLVVDNQPSDGKVFVHNITYKLPKKLLYQAELKKYEIDLCHSWDFNSSGTMCHDLG